jgi:glycosyltransferase involved in cell wall biosynthesis
MNVLVLTYWSFTDALVETYTLPYVRMIRKRVGEDDRVYLFTVERSDGKAPSAAREVSGARPESTGIVNLRGSYSPFGLVAAMRWAFDLVRLWWLCMTRRIRVIHAFCTPAGVAGYVLSVLTGAALIVDSYEPHAESMVENGTWRAGSVRHRVLTFFEGRMSARAQVLIGTTAAMEDYARNRYGVTPRSFLAKPACVDLDVFRPDQPGSEDLRERLGLTGKLVCVYAGKIGGIYLERELFEFFLQANDYWPDRFRVLMLTPAPRDSIDRLARETGLEPSRIVSSFVPHAEIARYLALGDFAVNPVKPVPSKRYCTSIKDGEYWATGLPVVITQGISDDSEIIAREEIGAVLRDLSPEAYRQAVREIDRLLTAQDRNALSERIRGVARRLRSPAIAEAVYASVYGAR